MPGEPTAGEVNRRLDDVRQDLKDDVRDLSARLGEKVNQEAYDARHTTLLARVSQLEALREKDAEKVAAMKRWWVATVVVPVAIILLQAYLSSKGAGS
jgi:hypothetical protein